MFYQPRTYRDWVRDGDLVSFNVVVRETDLHIRAATNLQRKATKLVLKHREPLERYLAGHPAFLTSLVPLAVEEDAPRIVKEMAAAAEKTGVGPMAAVAGAIAERVGQELLDFTPEVIVENGGDIFLKITRPRVVGIYAGTSPITGKLGLEIDGRDTPLGVCTSSGTVGHSLSFGQADAALALAPSAALADAAATALGNIVSHAADIPQALEFARKVSGLSGAVIIIGEHLGSWGKVKLCPTNLEKPLRGIGDG